MLAAEFFVALIISLKYLLIGVGIVVAIPTFLLEAKTQLVEFFADRRAEKSRAEADDVLFTELVEKNRQRPKKQPKHRLEDQQKNG